MRLSLVVATVGRTAELQRLLESLAAQTSRDFEVIVVDQNGDDRLASILEQASAQGVVIRHIRQAAKNASRARNTGLAAAAEAIVGFPDDDCWYEPDVVEKILDLGRKDPSIDVAAVRWVECRPADVSPRVLTTERLLQFRDILPVMIEMFFKRSLLEQLGGFDEEIGPPLWIGAGEEIDLVMRCARSQARIAYVPDIRVHHRFAADTTVAIAESCLKARERSRGTGALYAKHRLSKWVVIRGLVSPLLRCLTPPYDRRTIATKLAMTRGRWEGLYYWSRTKRG